MLFDTSSCCSVKNSPHRRADTSLSRIFPPPSLKSTQLPPSLLIPFQPIPLDVPTVYLLLPVSVFLLNAFCPKASTNNRIERSLLQEYNERFYTLPHHLSHIQVCVCCRNKFSIGSLTFQKCGSELFIHISCMSIMSFAVFIFIQFQTTITCMNVARTT